MATVAETPTTHKSTKAFYAHYFDEAGAITKVGGTLYFVSETGEVLEVDLGTLNFLTVLGAMALAEAQRLDDLIHGGAVGVCLSRGQEVQ